MVLKELYFPQFLILKGVVVMKELILNSFYFGEGVVAHERSDI